MQAPAAYHGLTPPPPKKVNPAVTGWVPVCGVRASAGFGCKWWGQTGRSWNVFVPSSQFGDCCRQSAFPWARTCVPPLSENNPGTGYLRAPTKWHRMRGAEPSVAPLCPFRARRTTHTVSDCLFVFRCLCLACAMFVFVSVISDGTEWERVSNATVLSLKLSRMYHHVHCNRLVAMLPLEAGCLRACALAGP